MGHGTAHDIMNEFKKAHKDLDIVNNLIQLSMDGPNVNWAFLDTLGRVSEQRILMLLL